jgi:hypothetical protein
MTHRANPPARAQTEPRAPRQTEPNLARRIRPQPATRSRHQPGAARQLTVTATVILLALILVAAVVHLIAAARARRLLWFAFPARPPGLDAAWGIFTGNLRLAAAPLTAALLLQLANRDGGAVKHGRALLDAIITIVLGLNIVIVGAGFGGYGPRMIRYALPHGPVELAGYCCALTVYTTARAGHPHTREAWLLPSASVALLAVAAVLEAVASPI